MSKRAVNNKISDLTNNPVSYTTENVALDVPSKKAKLIEKIEEAISSYENGTIKGDVVTDYMQGFLDPSFQGLIKQTKKDPAGTATLQQCCSNVAFGCFKNVVFWLRMGITITYICNITATFPQHYIKRKSNLLAT